MIPYVFFSPEGAKLPCAENMVTPLQGFDFL
jgi:hypothetical protein